MAPIVLFVYNRVDTLKLTIEALQNNFLAKKSQLFILSDGAKRGHEKQVKEVRKYIKSLDKSKFANVTIVEAKHNKGLANSIIYGVSWLVNHFGKIIVLEDDMITSKYFLQYMNEGLNLYQDSEDVLSVNAYIEFNSSSSDSSFFMRYPDCWGWGTWQRAWKLFEPNGQIVLKKLIRNKLLDRFMGRERCLTQNCTLLDILIGQIAGDNNSWYIRWCGSAILHNKLSLFYPHNLIRNIGSNGLGFHKDASNAGNINILEDNYTSIKSQKVIEDEEYCRKYII